MFNWQWLWRSPHYGQRGRGSGQEFRPLSLGIHMRNSELLEFHEREAARYRRLLANVTTPALKARLAEQAQEHERLAAGSEQSKDQVDRSERATAGV